MKEREINTRKNTGEKRASKNEKERLIFKGDFEKNRLFCFIGKTAYGALLN